MTSQQRPDQIPTTIQKSSDSDHMIFGECNVTTPNKSLLSVDDSVNPTFYDSSSLLCTKLCLKPEANDSDGKRHTTGALCHEYEHDVLKRPQHRKRFKVRDDLDLVCTKVKETQAKLSKSLSCLRINLHSSRKLEKTKPGIKVQYIECDSTERLWPHTDSTDNEDILDFPDHNYSPSLIITDLCDGCFGAQICVEALPRGDLTIRIRNYKMEIVVGRRPSFLADNHRITYPIRYGDINIPIYVNPASLCFEMDVEENILYVYGHTKGYQGSRKSGLSNSQRMMTHSLPHPSLSLNYHSDISLTKKHGDLPAMETYPPQNSLSVQVAEPFRSRALTQ